jgi:hypothetical protein
LSQKNPPHFSKKAGGKVWTTILICTTDRKHRIANMALKGDYKWCERLLPINSFNRSYHL